MLLLLLSGHISAGGIECAFCMHWVLARTSEFHMNSSHLTCHIQPFCFDYVYCSMRYAKVRKLKQYILMELPEFDFRVDLNSFSGER